MARSNIFGKKQNEPWRGSSVSEENETTFHCSELITGCNLTGLLTLTEEEIELAIYSYDAYFSIKPEEPIFVLTEKNDVVSLHSNVGNPPGQASRCIAPVRTIYRQDIISNIAVVGHDAWKSEDQIKCATFKVRHSDHLLRNKVKIDRIRREEYPHEDDLTIYKDTIEGQSLGARYGVIYGPEFDHPKEIWPRYSIEFSPPTSLHEYIRHVSRYVRFLSFCLGSPLKPSAIRIDRLSFNERNSALEDQSYPGDHLVHYVWPEAKIDTHDLWVGGSPALVWEDDELIAFRACLVAWMERAAGWDKAYTMMMTCLGLKREISAERLVNACRWFEEIPLAGSRSALTDADVEAIATAAARQAENLGHPPEIRSRIAGSIKRIKEETAEERFRRLVKMVQGKFGETCLPESAVADLKQALAFRGKTAHGHYSPESDSEFNAFSRAVAAMEALCMLLTAFELPLIAEGIMRMASNPVIRDYRHAIS